MPSRLPSSQKHAKRRNAYTFGVLAEYLAVCMFWCKGYHVLKRRFRIAGAEIDIVARKRRMLVLVEVKARHSIEACLETITPAKQQRFARAAAHLAAGGVKIAGLPRGGVDSIRFDVVWVAPDCWPRHIQDAWRL